MVKPDVHQNYYADLDLPANASVDDIRKSYHKLAKQFHPDRNAGRESECVPRFQAIQAANEVLSDPSLKAEYDQKRRNAQLFPPQPSGAATARQYQATSDFPPPPRRTQPGQYTRPRSTFTTPQGTSQGPSPGQWGQWGPAPGQSTPGTGSSGADKFSNFPRPNPPPRKDPAADRAQQFRAWQQMNNPKPRAAPGVPPGVPPGVLPREAPSGTAPTRPRAARQDTKMPTEEQIRANMRHGVGKPSGQPFSQPFGQTHDPNSAESKQSAWQAFNRQQADGGGPSTGRTKAQRTPKKAGGFDPSAASDEKPAPNASHHYSHRQRSEDLGSPHGPYPPPPPGPPPNCNQTAPQRPTASPLKPFRTRTAEEDVPYVEGNRQRSSYGFSSEGLRRSTSTRDTTKLRPEDAANTRAKSTSPRSRHGSTVNIPETTRKAFDQYDSSEQSSEEPDLTNTPEELDTAQEEAEKRDGTQRSADEAGKPDKERPIKEPVPRSGERPNMQENASGQNMYVNDPTQHNAPSYGDTTSDDEEKVVFTGRRASRRQFANSTFLPYDHISSHRTRSEEKIDTAFPSEGFEGRFVGSAGYFPPPSPARRSSPALKNAQKQRNNLRSATTDAQNGSGSMPPSPPRRTGSETAQNTTPLRTPSSNGSAFFADWHQKFPDASWAHPQAQQPQGKGNDRPNQPDVQDDGNLEQQSRPTTAAQQDPHVVDDNGADSFAPDDRSRDSAILHDADAMDIDSPQPPSAHSDAPRQTSELNKPPTGTNGNRKSSKGHRREHSSMHDGRFKVNLDDLANVEPIGKPPSAGLHNFAGMASELPFQSKAANKPPAVSLQPAKLTIPPLPLSPTQPSRVSKADWRNYCERFGRYLQDYTDWSGKILTHLHTRQKSNETRNAKGMDWLLQAGEASSAQDTPGAGGILRYAKELREDEQVRTAYNLGCDKHEEAVAEFEKLRGRVLELVQKGTLAEV